MFASRYRFLGSVGKGRVTDVVQERHQTNDLFRLFDRIVCELGYLPQLRPNLPPVPAQEKFKRLCCQFHHAEGVFETGVHRAWVYQVRHGQLPDVP